MSLGLELLGWTLLHSLWEMAAVWFVFRTSMRLLRRSSSQSRYLAGCASLSLCVIFPWVTFTHLVHAAAANLGSPWSLGMPLFFASAAVAQGSVSAHTLALPVDSALPSAIRLVGLTWILGCAWGAFQLVVDWLLARRLLAAPLRSLPDAINRRCCDLARRMGVRRLIRLGESMRVEVPSLIGWVKPAILVPVGCFTGLTPVQVDAVLAHEIAHVLRNDFPLNLLQSVCEILFFYHPAVRAMSHRVHLEREQACDDLAVGLTGDPLGLAEALALLEGARGPRLSLAVTGRSPLLSRIRSLLGLPPTPERSNSMEP